MAEIMGYVENGVKKRKKRRNGSAVKAASVSKSRNGVAKRRKISLAQAKNVIRANGLKTMSKSANPKRKTKRRKRNGIAAPRNYATFSRNGMLGNTKQDAKTVGFVLGGAGVTKLLSRAIVPWVAPHLSKVGAGNFSEIIVDAVLALTVIPMVASKISKGDAAKQARLGGLLVVGLDAIEMIAPDFMQYNPFNNSPVIVNQNGQALLTPMAAAALVDSTSATPQEKAAVGLIMREAARGNLPGSEGGMNAGQVFPMGGGGMVDVNRTL